MSDWAYLDPDSTDIDPLILAYDYMYNVARANHISHQRSMYFWCQYVKTGSDSFEQKYVGDRTKRIYDDQQVFDIQLGGVSID